ncbi:MAG: hypothetical protein H6718_21440 [Polyangiaceae bacterium]|nr:hypothetical protein [Myxococcales bacterium]MCB9587984.1 hypothetical protein [Polyangiaceae bacterium]
MNSKLPGLLFLSTVAACAGAPPPSANTPETSASATPESIPAEPVQPPAGDAVQDSAPPPQEVDETQKSAVSGPKEPPPLKGSLTPVSNAPVACSPSGVKTSLEELVKKCREGAKAVCGKLTVKAAKDADDVAVSLDVTTQDGVEDFVKCATDGMKSVRWECAEPGKDIQLELGECRL